MNSGQSLLEFVFSLPLILVAGIGTCSTLQDAYQRWDCEHRVFLATRKALNSADQSPPPFDLRYRIFLKRLPHGIEGKCIYNGHSVGLKLADLGETRD